MTTAPNSSGGWLVQPVIADEIIGLARASMVFGMLGQEPRTGRLPVSQITGLRGSSLTFPRQTSGMTPESKAEMGLAKVVDGPRLDAVTLNPHEVAVIVPVSKNLLANASMNVEAWLRNELATELATEVQKLIITGSGGGAVIQGMINDPALAWTNGAAAVLEATRLADQMGAVEDRNELLGVDTTGFLLSPKRVRNVKQIHIAGYTPQTKTDNPGFLTNPFWSDAQLEAFTGQKWAKTTHMLTDLTKAGGQIFGDWRHMLIAFWDQMAIEVSDSATVNQNGTLIHAFQQGCVMFKASVPVDWAFKRPGAFQGLYNIAV